VSHHQTNASLEFNYRLKLIESLEEQLLYVELVPPLKQVDGIIIMKGHKNLKKVRFKVDILGKKYQGEFLAEALNPK
jgi:hypothetical protein